MVSDFENLMELRQKIEKNGLKNEFYKKKYSETHEFNKRQKRSGFCCF